MLTFTLPTPEPRPVTIPLGRTVDRRQAWRERAEALAQAELHAAAVAQSTATVAGRRAEYQPMGNGIDKGFNVAQTATVTGEQQP